MVRDGPGRSRTSAHGFEVIVGCNAVLRPATESLSSREKSLRGNQGGFGCRVVTRSNARRVFFQKKGDAGTYDGFGRHSREQRGAGQWRAYLLSRAGDQITAARYVRAARIVCLAPEHNAALAFDGGDEATLRQRCRPDRVEAEASEQQRRRDADRAERGIRAPARLDAATRRSRKGTCTTSAPPGATRRVRAAIVCSTSSADQKVLEHEQREDEVEGLRWQEVKLLEGSHLEPGRQSRSSCCALAIIVGDMSSPRTSSNCCASARVTRPTPQPKSSALRVRWGSPCVVANASARSASCTPVARNSSRSHTS